MWPPTGILYNDRLGDFLYVDYLVFLVDLSDYK